MPYKRHILVTGGAGFIGSHVVRLFTNKYDDYQIINLDKLTYAGNLANLKDMISFGASPRASISLALAARAYAFIKRRGYVIPEDIRAVCHDVMRHRIGLSYEAEANNLTSEEVISEILNKVEVP